MTILNTLFDWILSAGLRASLLVPVVLVVQWLLRKPLPASWRYALWLPVLVALLVPTLPILPSSATPWLSSRATTVAPVTVEATPSPAPSEQALLLGSPDTPQATEVVTSAPSSPSAAGATPEWAAPSPESIGSIDSRIIAPTNHPAQIDWGAAARWAWLVGAGAVGLSILASFVATMRRVKRIALPVDSELLARVAHLASAAGLRRAPRVWRSTAVSSPAVCGLWRPVLLINERFEEDLSEEEIELILRHELTHIRRGDLRLNALQCVLLALHWFNPLLWLAFFRARADREAACDEAVLHGEPAHRRAAYGHALLKMETKFAPSGLCLGFVGILQGRGALRARIQSIIARRKLNAIPAAALATGIAMVALAGITGVGAGPEARDSRTYPPTDGDFVKNQDGRGTAKVWGIEFEVADPVGRASASRFEGGLHSDPEQTDARHEIKLGEDVIIRLEKVPGSPIRFEFNGEEFGTLEVGDRVVINEDRRVTVNGHPRRDPALRPIWTKWQKDIAAFDAELQLLAASAKIPDEEELKKRLEGDSRDDVEVITDGYGGVVDFNAAKGTVQGEANKMIGIGGPNIDWQFELAGDAKISYDGSTRLLPEIARVATNGEGDGDPFRFFITIAKANDGPFKAGDRVRLRASIDDFSRFRKDYTRATGLVAIYHLEDSPNPVYCLRLDEAQVTLITSAEQRTGKSDAAQPEGTSDEGVAQIDERPDTPDAAARTAISGKQEALSAARVAKAVADARQIALACQVYALDHDGTFPPTLAALLPRFLGPNAQSLIYSDPDEEKGLRWEYVAGLKATGRDKVFLRSVELYDGKRIVAHVDASVLALQESGGKEDAPAHDQAGTAWTTAHNRWPVDLDLKKVPANQSLEVFLHEYKAPELKGHRASPNLSDWDYEGATFGSNLGNYGYKLQLYYKGTKSGKDYYELEITHPEGDSARTMKRRLIYEGSAIEVFKDDEYRICIQPRSFEIQNDPSRDRNDQAVATPPSEPRENLPDLAKAFPGEKLFTQTKLEGTESYGYATDLPFEELKNGLTAFLGEGWEEVEWPPSAIEEVKRQNAAFLGNVEFTNPAFPGVQIGLTQIRQDLDGKKSAAVVAVGGLKEAEARQAP